MNLLQNLYSTTHRLFLLMAMMLVLTACKKTKQSDESNPDKQAKVTDIYVAGYKNIGGFSVATLWKNGIASPLIKFPSRSSAEAIITAGSDVYVAGYYKVVDNNYTAENNKQVGVYWKNGNMVKFTDSTKNAFISDIKVVKGDVYISGYYEIGHYVYLPLYWKNGIAVNLPTDGAELAFTEGIAVQGNDVYVCGRLNSNAVYWKNGVIIRLPGLENSTDTNDIAISGDDVYVVGTTGVPYVDNLPGRLAAVVWKNKVPTLLAGNNSQAWTITLQGKDVYIGGTTNNPTIYYGTLPVYWKNGIATVLPHGERYPFVSAVGINNDDIYVVGGDPDLGTICWKNNLPYLSDASSFAYANGIAFVNR